MWQSSVLIAQHKKFLWSNYRFLNGIVESSGITGIIESPEFWNLYHLINNQLKEHDVNVRIGAQQLKVLLISFIVLI